MLHFLHLLHLVVPKEKCFRFISPMETVCFSRRNTLFPWEKQSVPTGGTTGNCYPKQTRMAVVGMDSMGGLTGCRCRKCRKCTLFL